MLKAGLRLILVMNSHNMSDNEMDTVFAHALKNWGARQSPPVYVRARLLRKAGMQAEGTKMQQLGKNLIMRIRGLNPYWTGRPLSHAELAKWLFSQSMLDCLRIDRETLRVVC